MAGIGPVARFQQNRVEHSQLDHFAGHAVDLHPIAKAHAVFSHQHKPAQEPHDEILQRHSQARAGQAQNRPQLAWWPEYDQQNEKHREYLHGHAR